MEQVSRMVKCFINCFIFFFLFCCSTTKPLVTKIPTTNNTEDTKGNKSKNITLQSQTDENAGHNIPLEWHEEDRYFEDACAFFNEWNNKGIANNNSKKKILYIDKCSKNYDIEDKILKNNKEQISGIVLGQNAECYHSLSTSNLANICIDLSFLSSQRQRDVLEILSENLGALRLLRTTCSGETQPNLIDSISEKFKSLKYLEAEICDEHSISSNLFNELIEAKLFIYNGSSSEKMLKTIQSDSFHELRKLDIENWNDSNSEEWIATLPNLRYLKLFSKGAVDIEPIIRDKDLDSLFISSDATGELNQNAWPNIKYLILWRNDISKKQIEEFRKNHRSALSIFTQKDKVDYLFGDALKIDVLDEDLRAHKNIRETKEKILISITDKKTIKELASCIVPNSKPNNMIMLCTEGITLEIHNSHDKVEKVTINMKEQLIKWHNYGEIKISADSSKKISDWIDNHVVGWKNKKNC